MLQDLLVVAQNNARQEMERAANEEVKKTMGAIFPIPPWLLSRF